MPKNTSHSTQSSKLGKLSKPPHQFEELDPNSDKVQADARTLINYAMRDVGVNFNDLARMFEICAEECRTMHVPTYSDVLFNLQDDTRYDSQHFILDLVRSNANVLHECGYERTFEFSDHSGDIESYIDFNESYIRADLGSDTRDTYTYVVFNGASVDAFITRLAVKAAHDVELQELIANIGLKHMLAQP
jgi:hypothetical protein